LTELMRARLTEDGGVNGAVCRDLMILATTEHYNILQERKIIPPERFLFPPERAAAPSENEFRSAGLIFVSGRAAARSTRIEFRSDRTI